MATAEFAVVLPAVVLVLMFILALCQVVLLQHRAQEAASVAVRMVVRGDDDSAVQSSVQSSLAGAISHTDRRGNLATVTVTRAPGGAFGWVLPDVSATATGAVEHDDGP